MFAELSDHVPGATCHRRSRKSEGERGRRGPAGRGELKAEREGTSHAGLAVGLSAAGDRGRVFIREPTHSDSRFKRSLGPRADNRLREGAADVLRQLPSSDESGDDYTAAPAAALACVAPLDRHSQCTGGEMGLSK